MPKPLKFRDSQRVRKPLDLAGRLHRHSCVECRMSYSCSCDSPAVNGRCLDHEEGRYRPLWDRDYDPRECCVKPRLVKGEALDAYRLAGPGPWFRCEKCGRTNGAQHG